MEREVSPNRWTQVHRVTFEKFEFAVGGTVDIVASMRTPSSPGSTMVVILNTGDYERSKNENWRTICTEENPFKFQTDGVRRNFTIPTCDVYYFAVIECETPTSASTWVAQISYTLKSTPNGDQVPYSSIPLPGIFLGALILWVIIALIWSLTLFCQSSYSTPLHTILFFVIVLKLAVITIMTSYWFVYATYGTNVPLLDQLKNFLFTLSETAFFFLLYLYAKGWRTVRAGLPTLELRTTLVALVVLLLTLLFFTFYNNEYYWLSLIIVYFFLLPKFFSSISHNTRMLEAQISFFQRSNSPHVTSVITALDNKSKAFRIVRICVIVYLIIVLLVNSVFKALLSLMWQYSWYPILLNEIAVFSLVGIVCFFLAPKNNGVWLRNVNDLVPLLRAQHFINNDDGGTSEVQLEPWDLSKTIVIFWPDKNSPNSSTTKSFGPISVAYQEKYLKGQESGAKKSEAVKLETSDE